MKIRSSSEGVILLLSHEEAKEISKLFSQPSLFDPAPLQADPYHALRDNTRKFLDDCRAHFQNEWVAWSDPVYQSIRKRHYILQAGTVFARLEKMKAIECKRGGGKNKIKEFRLLF